MFEKVFKKLNETFNKLGETFDEMGKAFDNIDLGGGYSIQETNGLMVKSNGKKVIIKGDVKEVVLNGKTIYTKENK